MKLLLNLSIPKENTEKKQTVSFGKWYKDGKNWVNFFTEFNSQNADLQQLTSDELVLQGQFDKQIAKPSSDKEPWSTSTPLHTLYSTAFALMVNQNSQGKLDKVVDTFLKAKNALSIVILEVSII